MGSEQKSHTNLKDDSRFVLALRGALATPEGRYVFWRLLEAYGVRQNTFTGNALSGAFAQGMQNAGLLMEDLVQHASSEFFLQMLKEQQNENDT